MFYIVIDILFYLFLVAAIVAIVRYVKHWKTLKNLKSSGNPDLFLQAAKKYEGEGQNKAAFKWYEKAAQGGQAEALYELSRCYENSIGCTEDKSKAFQLCLSAAEKGVEKAQYRVGCCYEHGIGTETNIDQALFWYEEAQKNGNRIVASRIEKLKAKKNQ